MILKKIKLNFYRVLFFTGTLFFFIECAGRVKPWNFEDVYSLDVHLVESSDWLTKEYKNQNDLRKIMKKQFQYFLKKDMRIYERLEINFEMMDNALNAADSINKHIIKIYERLKETPGDSLGSVPKDSSFSYEKIIQVSSKNIQISKKQYYKSQKKLKKAFRIGRRKLIYIDDDFPIAKRTLYNLQYQREAINPSMVKFNKLLNQMIFEGDGSLYNKKIKKISKKIESYNSKLDRFEQFLMNFEQIAFAEVGSNVKVTSSKSKPLNYQLMYAQGIKKYNSNLENLKKTLRSI